MSRASLAALLALCLALVAMGGMALVAAVLSTGTPWGRIARRGVLIGCGIAVLVLLTGCGGCADCEHEPLACPAAQPAAAPTTQPVDCQAHPELCQ